MTCSVDECQRRTVARGWCSKHWQRWQRHGDPLMVKRPSAGPKPPAIERFWAKVDKSDTKGCWPWTAACDADGYGVFKVDGRMHRAARWIYEQKRGTLPAGHVVRHTCDRPVCSRPDHLIAGTVADNAQDMVDRGRSTRGDRHHTRAHPEAVLRGSANAAARLAPEQVRDIRTAYAVGETQTALAARFGVSQPLVSQIVRRVIWTHLE